MKKILSSVLLTVSLSAFAGGGGAPIALEKAPVNPFDIESIKRGAELFKTTCMTCHRMEQLQYNQLAKEAGITIDKMPAQNQDWWFGAEPPDLSLVARTRGPDWVYTFLHSFYEDKSRELGYNNLLIHNTSMPNMIAPWQGSQVLVEHPQEKVAFTIEPQWYDLLKQTKPGSMSAQQYHDAVADIVNFLDYAGEPHKADRLKLGKRVMIFLLIFFFVALMLKKEYWKDVKRHRNDV